MMKKNRSALVVVIILILISCVVLSTQVYGQTNYPSSEIINTPKETPPSNLKLVFYRLSSEDEAKIKQIVLSDTMVQSITDGKKYILNVGATLKADVDFNTFWTWIKADQKDMTIVKSYVGELIIGYNQRFFLLLIKKKAR
jgi:hypothetical protein